MHYYLLPLFLLIKLLLEQRVGLRFSFCRALGAMIVRITINSSTQKQTLNIFSIKSYQSFLKEAPFYEIAEFS